MYKVLKKGTIIARSIETILHIDSEGNWAEKSMSDVYGEIHSVNTRKQEYHIIWDGGIDWEVLHFWEFPLRKDIRIAKPAEIVLFKKSD